MEQVGYLQPLLWWGNEEQDKRVRQEEQGQTIFSLFSFFLSRSNSARGEAGTLAPVETIHVQVKGIFLSQSFSVDPPETDWSKWGSWSLCSKTCGGGTQSRERDCMRELGDCMQGNSTETSSCGNNPCPGETFVMSGSMFSLEWIVFPYPQWLIINDNER